MKSLASQQLYGPRLDRYLERLWAWAGGVSVRTKILGIILTLTVVLGLGVTWQVRLMMNRTLMAELEERGVSVASDLAARSVDPILLNDTFALYELLTETLTNHSDIVYAFVLDPQGKVLAHTFDDGFPTALLTLNTPLAEGDIHHQLYTSDQGRIHDFAAPIFEAKAGTIRLGVSENRLQSTINVVTGQMLFTTLIVALGGIAAASFLTWLLTRPILKLVETTRRVGQGDLSARAPHWANDEIGTLADAFNQMVMDLAVSQQALAEKEVARGQLLEKIITAQEEERRRIARELHDDTSQALTSLKVGLKVLEGLHSPEQFQQYLVNLREIVDQTLESVHDLALELRPSVLDDLGLAAALNRYVAEYQRRFGLKVDYRVIGFEGRRLPSAIETALYRIVQEALTNVARHAGATHSTVFLDWTSAHLRVIVEDNGRGFEPAVADQERKLGLYGMKERASLIGGELHIESEVGVGTTLVVHIPGSAVMPLAQVIPTQLNIEETIKC